MSRNYRHFLHQCAENSGFLGEANTNAFKMVCGHIQSLLPLRQQLSHSNRVTGRSGPSLPSFCLSIAWVSAMLRSEVMPHDKNCADNWLTCMKLTDTCCYPAPCWADVTWISVCLVKPTEYDTGKMEGLPARPREEGGGSPSSLKSVYSIAVTQPQSTGNQAAAFSGLRISLISRSTS